jgi:CheY-like chemotaxis protein
MPSVLVVDDDARLVQVIEMYLQNEGYQVLTASGGVAALEALRTARPDVVVLDVMMPDVSGIEVCRRMRASEALRTTPVLVLTAFPGSEGEAIAAGANRFVPKPFSLEGLRAELDGLIHAAGA